MLASAAGVVPAPPSDGGDVIVVPLVLLDGGHVVWGLHGREDVVSVVLGLVVVLLGLAQLLAGDGGPHGGGQLAPPQGADRPGRAALDERRVAVAKLFRQLLHQGRGFARQVELAGLLEEGVLLLSK